MTEEHKAEEASEKEGIYFGKSFACLYQQRTTLCLSGNESSGVLTLKALLIYFNIKGH